MGVIRPLILSLLLAWPAAAQLGVQNPFYVAGLLNASVAAGSGDACGSCTNETFEGIGYSVAGWTEAVNGGIVNEDYTTAPAPIVGSQSLLIKDPADSNSSYDSINMPAVGEVWIRFACVITNTVVNGARICFARDSGAAVQCGVEIRGAKLRIKHGTVSADTATSITADTTNYIWFHYLKGSGANGVADVGFSQHPTKTRPTGGGTFASVSTGTATANILGCGIGVEDVDFAAILSGVIFDSVSLTTSGVIGDFP
jgi:hypothetical protein